MFKRLAVVSLALVLLIALALPTFAQPDPPLLKVEPVSYTAEVINEIFSINVTINDLSSEWQIIGAEFKLRYNTTLLEVLSVAEGPFLRAFSGEPNQGVFTTSTTKADYVIVGIVILPDGHGVWHTPFPSGSGALATITFEAIYQSLGLGHPPDTCALELFDVKLSGVPYNAEPPGVPSTAKNGSYEIIPRWNIADLNNDGVVDIFDLATVAVTFGSEEGQPKWNPIADLNNDGIVDIFDLVLIAIHFGETRP